MQGLILTSTSFFFDHKFGPLPARGQVGASEKRNQFTQQTKIPSAGCLRSCSSQQESKAKG